MNAPPRLTFAVSGYKSLRDEVEVTLAPLTFLMGANSSGKSAVMEPLLLLKQTIEADYATGVLRQRGPHVELRSPGEAVWRRQGASFRLVLPPGLLDHVYGPGVRLTYRPGADDFDVQAEVRVESGPWAPVLRGVPGRALTEGLEPLIGLPKGPEVSLQVEDHRRGVPRVSWSEEVSPQGAPFDPQRGRSLIVHHVPWLVSLFHLPRFRDLRPPSERLQPDWSSEGIIARGLFPAYAPRIVERWQVEDSPCLTALNKHLFTMGLASRAVARSASEQTVMLEVGRTLTAGADDLVPLQATGSGVTQALPILVALIAAARDQVVYIEQPELHLHPRAELALGSLLVDAAKRGVRVVVETHSKLMLRAAQIALVKERLKVDDLALHWFSRDVDGATRVERADLDGAGRFGAWPIDFSEVEEQADDTWLQGVVDRPRAVG